MKYRVLKPFYDRFDGGKLNQAGDEHHPPSKQRAVQLMEQGFIVEVEEPKEKKKKKAADKE